MKRNILIIILLCLLMASVSAQEINISHLSLDEKIAQMLMVRGNPFCGGYLKAGVGGIFLDQEKTEEVYRNLISTYQNSSKIKLFIATDMEGYWNPFPFFKSKNFGEIKTAEEAEELGKEHGKVLSQIGFNIDFSPVVEAKNTVWPGRSFTGTSEEIKAKIKFYIRGLQEQGIIATAKHYPGGNLLKDPHIFKVHTTIDNEDISFFDAAINENVSAIMVGHTIVAGEIDSKGRQASVSPEVIAHLRKSFDGIVITDAISMLGLKYSYLFNKRKIYVDAIKAGNDIVLESKKTPCNPKSLRKTILTIKKSIALNEISEKQIDKSVARILKLKGYSVVY